MRLSLLLASALLVASAAASAAEFMQFDAVRSQQAEIRAGVEAGTGIYKKLPGATRDQVLVRQNALLRMIDGKQSSSELREPERMELVNSLAWIEATVNQTGDERLVCERQRRTGSNMTERVCRTVAQIRKDREAARSAQQEGQRQLLLPKLD